MPARCIPDRAIVTKKTGKKEYTLSKEMRFFGDQDSYPNVYATNDVRFLIADNAVNIVSADQELLWCTYWEDLQSWMECR